MTPPRVHCRDCHRDSNPDDIAVVTSIIHDQVWLHDGIVANLFPLTGDEVPS